MDNKHILIVVDAQNDFVSGSLAIEGAAEIVPKIKKAVQEFRSGDYYTRNMNKVVFTRDTHDYGYLNTLEGKKIPTPHCIAETPGWCIVDELAELAADNYIIDKDRFGITFWKEWFNKKEWDVKSITLGGFASNICVVSNALVLQSLYPNLPITVRKDLCAGTSPELHEAAMKIMESCCIDVVDGGW